MKNKKGLIFAALLVLVLGLTLVYTSSNNKQSDVKEDTPFIVTESDELSQAPSEAAYIDVSPQEASDLIEEITDLVIIDVSPHYDDGHLPGAVHYYLGDGSLDEAIPTLDKTKTYLVYCHVDSVSIAGAQKLIDAGFPTVYRLEGNYPAWVDAGFPVETPSD